MALAGWLRIWLRLSSSAKVPLGAIGDGFVWHLFMIVLEYEKTY